jgi:MFS family permease
VTIEPSSADLASPPPDDGASGGWFSPGVAAIAGASALSDLGHEIGTSLLPTLLTTTLHGGPAALGLIEGISDALIGVAKLAGGPLANDPDRRGRQAVGGYLVTGLASGALGGVGAVWQVGLLRASGWAARGLRSPARDALLYDLVEPSAFGRASGAERAGDNAGALLGPLLASGLLAWFGIRAALYLTAIPGVFAAVAITVAARQARRHVTARKGRRTLSLNARALRDAGLARALVPAAAFELGNVAATLLILRATQLLHDSGRGPTAAAALAVLLYAAHNGTAAVASLVGGHWADRAGPRRVFAVAALAYVAGYAVFAAGPHLWPALLVGFVLAGVGIGFAETAQSTMVAQVAPAQLRGSAFGLLGLTQAVGDLGSTAVVGVLWAAVSPTLGFGYAAAWMLIAVVAATTTGRRT